MARRADLKISQIIRLEANFNFPSRGGARGGFLPSQIFEHENDYEYDTTSAMECEKGSKNTKRWKTSESRNDPATLYQRITLS